MRHSLATLIASSVAPLVLVASIVLTLTLGHSAHLAPDALSPEVLAVSSGLVTGGSLGSLASAWAWLGSSHQVAIRLSLGYGAALALSVIVVVLMRASWA